VGAILLVATVLVLKESGDPDAKELDVWGIATFSSALFLLIWAVIDGNNIGWRSPAIELRLLAAVILFAAFVVVELRQERPMVDFSLFRQPNFVGTAFAMLGYSGGAQVMIFYLPMFLQNSYGFTPAKAGLAMLPFALPMFFTPRLGVKLALHYSTRELLTLGLATTLAGDLSLFLFAHIGAVYPVFALGMAVAGTGAGLLNSETSKAMQGAVPPQRSGMASGLTSTVRFTGLLLAVAGLGATLSSHVSRHFVASATALGLDPHAATLAAARVASGDLTQTVASLPESMRAQVLAAASAAFADGFAAASLMAALVTAVATTLAYVLVEARDSAASRSGSAIAPSIHPME
jgi:Major Facilitator Superfamily